MQNIRAHLSINYFIVLFIGMALAGALVWVAVSKLYIDTQRENLLAQAKLIAASFQDTTLPMQASQPYSQTSNVVPGIHARLIGDSGAVLVGLPLSDEMIQLSGAEQYGSISPGDLLQRPEIDSALNGTPATAQRKVIDSQRVLYAAAPVENSNGQISGIVYIAMPLPSGGLPPSMILQLFGAAGIAVLLAALAGRVLARKITVPLEELANAAAVVSKGDLKQSVSINTDILEFQRVSQTFNEMTENLRRSDEVKKSFIADVTHELRTPLTVIKGTIETLEDGALDDLKGRGSLLSSMMRETDRLIRMVNELLVLTRADAGSLQLNIQKFNLVELARTRCENINLLATRKKVEFKIVSAFQSFYIHADPDRISQVIDNLLGNAIRHSPENSCIVITINSQEDGIECSVNNTGTGIPAKHLPFIFDRFYRVESSRDRISGGTGLGLAIARAIINAHGGKIFAESIEGTGTTITFWLPKEIDIQLTTL